MRARTITTACVVIFLLALGGHVVAAPPPASTPATNADMEAALYAMDHTAANFRHARTDFIWKSYELVVNDTSEQRGQMFIQSDSKRMKLAAHIQLPKGEEKYLLVVPKEAGSGSEVRVYQPRINQVTVYDPGKNREAFESFLVLGFGGSGHNLLNQFAVKPVAIETVDNARTIKLELTPKSQRVTNLFTRIELWIDPNLGVSRQQKFIDPSGNYRLALYTNITINKGLPRDAFASHENKNTVVVNPKQ